MTKWLKPITHVKTRRKKILKTVISLITACCSLFVYSHAAFAGTLPLPEAAKTISTQISEQCPGCLDMGFSPAGTENIGFGKKFFPNFIMGTRERGVLVSYIMAADSYISVLRKNDLKHAKNILKRDFSDIKLFIVEKKGYGVFAALQPQSVEVNVTDQLHACLLGSDKPLCCCCTDCKEECCEKRLGSTHVTVRWNDPMHAGQTIVYTWYPHAGDSKIHTLTADGRRTELRWCLDSSGPGFLK